MERFFPTMIMCTIPGCGSLASGIYYCHDGSIRRTCTLHIPQAPALPEEPCPA